jgi:hypothetical protein
MASDEEFQAGCWKVVMEGPQLTATEMFYVNVSKNLTLI